MFKVLDTIKERVKQQGVKEFLLGGVWLEKESVIEEQDIEGCKVLTTIDPNGNKNSFCLRQYCFSNTSNYQTLVDCCMDEELDKRICKQMHEVAVKRNSTPILVSQIILFDFDFDMAGSFSNVSANIEKTDYKYINDMDW